VGPIIPVPVAGAGSKLLARHDHIADLAGVPGRSLVDTYSNEISQMKRCVVDYVKMLRATANPLMPVPLVTEVQHIPLKIANDGFPYLESSFHQTKYKKKELEQGFYLYVGQHYKLANNNCTRSVPFKMLLANVSTFIAPEYLPANFEIRDPRNMLKDTIQDFFDHVFRRQMQHGRRNAFAFKVVKTGSGLIPAKYPEPETVIPPIGPGATASHLSGRTQTVHPSQNRSGQPPSHTPGAAASHLSGRTRTVHPSQNRSGQPPPQAPGAAASHLSVRTQTVFQHHSHAQSDIPHSQGFGELGPDDLDPVLVDQSQMDILSRAGVPVPMPVNGPSDGPPQYMVEQSLYNKYIHSGNEYSVPAPGPVRTKRTNADTLAIKEATLGNKPKPRPKSRKK
jgi:hypothetical protein